MQEAKLSLAQQRDLKARMVAGADLPKPLRASSAKTVHHNNLFDIKRNYYFSKRSRNQIVRSGAYEPDRCWTPQVMVDRDKAKEDLQNIMTFGKKTECRKVVINTKPKKIRLTKALRLEELHSEIEDRLIFLDEMKELKMHERYKTTIAQEISGKLREIKQLERMTDAEFDKIAMVSQ